MKSVQKTKKIFNRKPRRRAFSRRARVALAALILASIFLCLFSGCTAKSDNITDPLSLNSSEYKIGVSPVSAQMAVVEELLPNAKPVFFDNAYEGYTALAQGKIDAYVFDRLQMQLAIDNGQTGVRLLEENLGEDITVGAPVAPSPGIPDLYDKFNQFLAEIKGDGTFDDIFNRWYHEKNYTMPEIELDENASQTLIVGTTGLVEPYTFYEKNELAGTDIEIAYRFAQWLGANIKFKVYDYSGLISAIQSNDVDIALANVHETTERMEAVEFSDPLYTVSNGVMIRDETSSATTEYTDVDQLAHSDIGIVTGTTFTDILLSRLPDAQPVYYNSFADCIEALSSGKIDAFVEDEPIVKSQMLQNDSLTYLDEPLHEFDIAYALSKENEELEAKLSEYILTLNKDGTLDELQEKWFEGIPTDDEVIDYRGLPATNGEIKVCSFQYEPFSWLENDYFRGYEVEILARFCKEYGYALTIDEIDPQAAITAVVSGKYDIAFSCIGITAERAESVLFTESTMHVPAVLVVKKAVTGSKSFLTSVKESFRKTFIVDDRYRMFIRGILTTLLITALSIIFGTLLGFAIYMCCRRKNKIANAIAGIFVYLIHGMPVVVLIMVLYYIIFSAANIDGTIVSIIGFTLIFASSVFSMLKDGVNTIDIGQTEGAYALGYTDTSTFFKVILPQALPFIMPSYRLQVVELIKATAIVGYIAVQDLTKIGDIVRSRTYEAFFPLIAVALIYFALGGILTFIIKRIEIHIDPKRRSRKRILKGISQPK